MKSIQFDSVSKYFKIGRKKSKALHELTLSVNQSEIFGFLGPNGAGKSTAIKLLLNFIRPNSGSIKINGLSVGKEAFQHFIGYLPETPCFYENLTGAETLWFAGKSSKMSKKDIQKKSLEVLTKLNLETASHNRIKTYSKGMKQRLGLAMALLHEPEIYILDEPMSGLDPMGRRLVTDVILELRDKGKTVFFSSHILSDIERLCDGIGILNKGRLLYCGNVTELMKTYSNLEDSFINFIEKDNRISHG